VLSPNIRLVTNIYFRLITKGYSGGFPLANHKSAEKRARQSVRRSTVNTARKSRVKTIEKKLINALGLKDLSAVKELYKALTSLVDRAAKAGVVSKSHADRKKSRIATRISQITK
jgi:small subunit ribosomal protein S20